MPFSRPFVPYHVSAGQSKIVKYVRKYPHEPFSRPILTHRAKDSAVF